MSEVRIYNPKTGGEKNQKPERYDLIPWDAMDEVARVYAHGAEKYADNNWRRGFNWSLSIAAALRHMAAFAAGEDDDPESGLSHMAHATFHTLALATFAASERYAELDDRYIPPFDDLLDTTSEAHREWRRERGYMDPPDHHDCDCGCSMNGETCGCGLSY